MTNSHSPCSAGSCDEPLYRVDIWNTEGDVVKHFRDLTADEVDEIRDQYEDEPWLSVVVEEQ